ncbi:AraC family transcriptional regulator [Bradyrhizobium sp. 2]|uniref:AraC family transcriptional regulator n=1 Tax=unclassified Bradyrhizobium TaxID=2631580 RepID=UPI001FF854C5|nr:MULTISPECIES: AraC family transcriptional regulator [unclassified Bradyrhizobium]MCK1447076.1 AraC family transcriptional regulator [Bradyrhizobium sp. 48]MCK1464857.1 AraC family transcriptional regulator [Bradyrhizobium sp. 2]
MIKANSETKSTKSTLRGYQTKSCKWVNSLDGTELFRAAEISHRFPVHAHDSYAIPLVEQGAMKSFYRRETHIISCGMLDIVNPGEPHTGEPAHDLGWTYRCLYIDAHLMSAIASELADKLVAPPIFRGIPSEAGLFMRLIALCDRLEIPRQVGLAEDVELRELLAQLIGRYTRPSGEVSVARRENQALNRARNFIEDNYDRSMRLHDLAELTGLNPIYLVRAFRNAFGLPPHSYQRRVRIDRAREQLRQGREIARVAAETGFSDQSHLTRHFKAVVGVTPGAYRRGS